ATQVLFDRAALDAFYTIYAAFLVLALVVSTGPLLVFLPMLAMAKHHGLLEYGVLASRYTRLFGGKWLSGQAPPDEPLLGSADIQSLAALGNAFANVKNMRLLPVEMADFVAIAIPTVLPALPLAALVMPLGEIVQRLLHLLI